MFSIAFGVMMTGHSRNRLGLGCHEDRENFTCIHFYCPSLESKGRRMDAAFFPPMTAIRPIPLAAEDN